MLKLNEEAIMDTVKAKFKSMQPQRRVRYLPFALTPPGAALFSATHQNSLKSKTL